ncbi:MAG: hypothetical protein GVY29_02385 [Spirochaetes bacterium]|jgi:hypothetical protein|nr:hypothetical protein [Spirochaetota bacterium]
MSDFEPGSDQTASVTDFRLQSAGPPPVGYPAEFHPDSYATEPFASRYEERRKALFEFWRRNPAGTGIKAHFVELVRLHLGERPVHEELFAKALDYIDRRIDCSDFVMLGIIRARRQFPESSLLSADLHSRMKRSILDFKYHPEEPGLDSLCTWTENHQIMFAANAFLAGKLYPEETFTNSGERGREKALRARPRILKWLDLRYKTGFSEWLSHIYYDEDITALTNLIDFSGDLEIVEKSTVVLDLIFLDMALNSFRGTFGSTHGRSYAEEKRDGHLESTADTSKLMFGMGIFSGRDNMSAVSLALSEYRLPEAIYAIATDRRTTFENRQRAGIRIAEAKRWGLTTRPGDVESAMALLTLEAYTHPRTIMQMLELFDRFRWWRNAFFGPFASYRRLLTALRKTRLLPLLARLIEKDITRNVREEVNILTYRSPEAMLSTAQDWKAGYGGDQQHILQATLSARAVVFPTHPGHAENTSGGYWVGSGTLPRAVQVGPVAIAVYRASRAPGLYMTNEVFFTHAWFPHEAFDEVREAVHGGQVTPGPAVATSAWIFGRLGDGYVALYSRNGYRRQTEGPDAGAELIAPGRKNVWILEVGSRGADGGFDQFIRARLEARITHRGLGVDYTHPTVGRLQVAWRGRPRRNGEPIATRGYPRYQNPFVTAAFPPEEVVVSAGDYRLRLDWSRQERQTGNRDSASSTWAT